MVAKIKTMSSVNNSEDIYEQIANLINLSNQSPAVVEDPFGFNNSKHPVKFFGDDVIKAITDHIGPHLKDPNSISYMDMLVPPVGFPRGFYILKWLPLEYNESTYWNKESLFYFSKRELDLMAWNLLLQTKNKNTMCCTLETAGVSQGLNKVNVTKINDVHKYKFESEPFDKDSKHFNKLYLLSYNRPFEGETFSLISCSIIYQYNNGSNKKVKIDVSGKEIKKWGGRSFGNKNDSICEIETENVKSVIVKAKIEHSDKINFLDLSKIHPVLKPCYEVIRDNTYKFINGDINLVDCLEDIKSGFLSLPKFEDRTDL